jgi:hypothetical protein
MKPPLVALAVGLVLVSAANAVAQTNDRTGSCAAGHRFEPGPIVNGHHRQPTLGEVEARTQQLRLWNKVNADSCRATPVPVGSATIMSRLPAAAPPDRVVELDPPADPPRRGLRSRS